MPRPIKVDNSRPATVWDTARTLGVSKKRTEEIIREVGHMIRRNAKTGEVVIEFRRKTAGRQTPRNGTKASRTISSPRKITLR